MSLISTIANLSTVYNYEQAFGATDCTTTAMRDAIRQWYILYYNKEQTRDEDPCQQIAFTVVRKITKTAFGEYKASATGPDGRQADDFTVAVIDAFDRAAKEAMQQALIGGTVLLKIIPDKVKDVVRVGVITRPNMLIFGRDQDGKPNDIGLVERSVKDGKHYSLLERRTLDGKGYLTIREQLFMARNDNTLGQKIPLGSLPEYAELQDEYRYPEAIHSLGVIAMSTPLANCVDDSKDAVSVYAPAVGLIRNINRNEAQINGEFERAESRIITSSDMLKSHPDGTKGLDDHLFTGLDDDLAATGITIFSPAIREKSFLVRKTEYLRNVESIIGLKRGLLSDVEATEKTATEVTSSAGDYNLTIIDFQEMWEDALKEGVRVAGALARLHRISQAHDIDSDIVSVDWGNGVLYDEDKTWAEYMAMVGSGLLKPEIALGWRFNMPTDTPEDLQAIREKYMPDFTAMAMAAAAAGGGEA